MISGYISAENVNIEYKTLLENGAKVFEAKVDKEKVRISEHKK